MAFATIAKYLSKTMSFDDQNCMHPLDAIDPGTILTRVFDGD